MGCESPRLWAMGKLERGWGQAGLWGGVQLRKGILLPSLLLLLSRSQHPGEGWECSVLGRAPWSRLRAHGLVLCVKEGALAWIWLWTGFCCIPRDAAAPLFGFIYPSDFLGAFFCFSCFLFLSFFPPFFVSIPIPGTVNRGQISPTALPPSLSTELCCSQGANAARKEPEPFGERPSALGTCCFHWILDSFHGRAPCPLPGVSRAVLRGIFLVGILSVAVL